MIDGWLAILLHVVRGPLMSSVVPEQAAGLVGFTASHGSQKEPSSNTTLGTWGWGKGVGSTSRYSHLCLLWVMMRINPYCGPQIPSGRLVVTERSITEYGVIHRDHRINGTLEASLTISPATVPTNMACHGLRLGVS